jgi:hypothetical protein
MDDLYFSKYKKYKLKYLSLLKKKFKVLQMDNDNFLNNYRKIPNSGQQNCGIYLSDDDTKIIKCENHELSVEIQEHLYQIIKSYPNYKIFPQIYNIYNFQRERERETYTEMEKFQGDLTQFLYEILPKKVLSKMTNLTEDDRDFYYRLFNLSIPNKISGNNLYRISDEKHNEMLIYLYYYPAEVDTVVNIIAERKRNNNNEDYLYKDIKVNMTTDYIRELELLNNTIRFFKNPIFLDDNFIRKYEDFIKKYETDYNSLLLTIEQQVYRIILLLNNIGLTFRDYKLDNFAFTYGNTNNHLGIKWSNNYLGDNLYLNISLLDWGSGLSIYDLKLPSTLNNFTKYGQTFITSLKRNMLFIGYEIYNKSKNIFELDQKLVEYYEKEYNLDLKINTHMKTFNDLNKFVNNNNNVIFKLNVNDFYTNKLLYKYSYDKMLSDKSINFYIDKKPTIINKDGDKKYLIKCDAFDKIKYKNPSQKEDLLYILQQKDKVYLVNFDKKTTKYKNSEFIQDNNNDDLIKLINNYCTIPKQIPDTTIKNKPSAYDYDNNYYYNDDYNDDYNYYYNDDYNDDNNDDNNDDDYNDDSDSDFDKYGAKIQKGLPPDW